jgi:hypothetical protein
MNAPNLNIGLFVDVCVATMSPPVFIIPLWYDMCETKIRKGAAQMMRSRIETIQCNGDT